MKTNSMIIIVCIAVCGSFACRRDLQVSDTMVDAVVAVTYDTAAGNFSFPKQGIKITLSNQRTGNSLTYTTDANGKVIMEGISSSVYNITATISLSAAQYLSITGIKPKGDSVIFNASVNTTPINRERNTAVELKLQSGIVGDWVIKQIYFAGSHRTLGALYRDQFIELYNNSTDTLYADSLYIATLIGVNNTTINTGTGYISSGAFIGQYNWQQALNMPANIDANNDYVYAKSMYMIPGTGTTYPVAPGKGILIAQTAVNHKAPFVGSDGTAISVQDPSLTVDLSSAEFEAYVAPYVSKPLDSDIDVPSSVNMEPVKIFGTDMIFDNPGRDGFAIIKVNTMEAAAKLRSDVYWTPNLQNPSTTTQYNQIPVKFVLDAVETQPSTTTSRVPKKLRDNLDAGFTFVPGSSYSSQSVIRKTAKIVGSRIVLMDTNNSYNDFTYLAMANPRGFAN